MRISHEIYSGALCASCRGALKRSARVSANRASFAGPAHLGTRQRRRTFVSPEIMICQRPAEADDRAVHRTHWEGDLILGLRPASATFGTAG